MTRMIRRFLCLALAAVMMAALLPFAVSGTTAKAASSTGIVTLEGVNFRVGPSMKDKVLFKISKGTVCPVLNKVTANGYDWYEVTGRDPESGREYTGYIRGDCFRMLSEGESGNNGNSSAVVTAKPTNSSATANNLPAPANAVGTINNWGVNFRSAPWGNVLASLDKGTQVTVLTVPQTVSRQNWYQVQYNGQQGYIMATYLDYSGKTYTPIGTVIPGTDTEDPIERPFNGIFDGNFKSISGITIKAAKKDYIGVFGLVGQGSEIKNLVVTNSTFIGNQYVGGIVGYDKDGGIKCCNNIEVAVSGENLILQDPYQDLRAK